MSDQFPRLIHFSFSYISFSFSFGSSPSKLSNTEMLSAYDFGDPEIYQLKMLHFTEGPGRHTQS